MTLVAKIQLRLTFDDCDEVKMLGHDKEHLAITRITGAIIENKEAFCGLVLQAAEKVWENVHKSTEKVED